MTEKPRSQITAKDTGKTLLKQCLQKIKAPAVPACKHTLVSPPWHLHLNFVCFVQLQSDKTNYLFHPIISLYIVPDI